MNDRAKLQLQDLDLDAVLAQIYAHSTSMSSSIHGESHWLRVTKVGLELAKQSVDCDLTVIFLFGLFHDTQRLDDGRDPEHGERSANFVRTINARLLPLSTEQLKALSYACHEHNNGAITDDPTISICWDADRLNLWRVMTIPSGKYLSSPIAKQWSMQFRALTIQFQSYTWHDLFEQYIVLSDKVGK